MTGDLADGDFDGYRYGEREHYRRHRRLGSISTIEDQRPGRRISDAATRVTVATEIARRTSNELTSSAEASPLKFRKWRSPVHGNGR